MRVLMVCRLMSGFVESLRTGIWRPGGAPAIGRLIEALDKGPHDVRLVLTRGLDEADEMADLHGREIRVSGLSGPIHVQAAKMPGPARIARYLQQLAQVWWLWREARARRPDIIYMDRSNVLAAAVLARWTKTPVFLRVLGVPPDLNAMLDSDRFGARLLRWAYRAPFVHVRCTREGSGGADWLARALDAGVPRDVILNGVDKPTVSGAPPQPLDMIPPDCMVVTLLGRVEALKGSDVFVDALLGLPDACRGRIHAVVVGSGTLLDELRERVVSAGAEDYITFTGALPHDAVGDVLARTDVYVSLNRQGHLSNATLEAISAGVCLVLRQTKPVVVPDPELEDLVPPDAMVALPRQATPDDLAMLLCQLADDPERRRTLARALAEATSETLRPWDERIAEEVALLERLAEGAEPQ